MSNILNLVSIARKAGKLELGEEPTVSAARSRQAKLILVAADATENTYRRVRHVGANGNVTWVSIPCSKAELGRAVGRSAVAMLAVMDIGLATAMVRGLAQEDPEKYAIPLERMTTKNEKAQRRLQEKRQHEKNLKTGKYQAKHREKELPTPEEAPPPQKEAERVAPRKPIERPRRFGDRPPQRKGRPTRAHRGRSNPYEHFDTERPKGKYKK